MAQSPIRKPYVSIPRGWLGWRALGWGLAAGLTLALSIFLASLAVVKLRVPVTQSYAGNLTSAVNPEQIIVPSGVAISEYLVSVDETVRRGQTLLVFDQSQLEQERLAMENAAESLKAELQCLRNLHSSKFAQDDHIADTTPAGEGLGTPTPEQEAETQETPTPRCTVLEAKKRDAERAFGLKRQDIRQEIEIISNFIETSTPGPLRLDVVETQEVLERRLALALARHVLSAQQNALEIAFAEQRQEFEETHLSLATDIGSELAEVDKTRAQLSHLIKAPRIQAPVAGRVLRLRHVTPQQVLPQDTEVLSILPSQNDGYRIAFSAEPADLSFLKIGQDVHIDILGLPQRALTLDAKINEIATDGPNRVAVLAQVSQASQAVLAKSPYSQQIRDASSAVAIRAYRQDISLINLFRTTSKDLLPETLWWRTAQTSSETALERSAQTWVFPKPQLPLDLF